MKWTDAEKLLRDDADMHYLTGTAPHRDRHDAADVVRAQAARIAELEATLARDQQEARIKELEAIEERLTMELGTWKDAHERAAKAVNDPPYPGEDWKPMEQGRRLVVRVLTRILTGSEP